MIYFDKEYFIDTQYKFNYNDIYEININDISNNIININKAYKSVFNNINIYLVYGKSNFYTKDVYYCKQIGQNIYKVIIDEPQLPSSLSLKRTYNKQIKTKNV